MAHFTTSLLLMGYNETGRLGEGWHDLERDGRTGVAYRATRAAADLTLPLASTAHTLFMLYSGSPTLAGKALTGRLELAIETKNSPGTTGDGAREKGDRPEGNGVDAVENNRRYTAPLHLQRDNWSLCTLDLPPCAEGLARLRIYADLLVIPDRVLHNGDARALGFYVSALWIR